MKKILISTVLTEAFYKSRLELIEELLGKNYQVILVGPEKDNKIKEIFNDQRVKFYIVNFDRTGISIYSDLKAMVTLFKIIRKEKPTFTYAFGGAKAAIYTTIAGHFGKVDNKYCMINGLGSIYRGHGYKNRAIRIIMNLLFKYSLSKAEGVLFQNIDDLNVFVKNGLVSNTICKIVNGSGVNLSKFGYCEPNTNKIIFLFVGRLLKDKGIYEFAEAAKEVKREFPLVEFWVIGGIDSNPTSVSNKEMSLWTEKGYIKYFGKKNDVLEYYKKSSVFVLPSYHEGTPRTNLEAMAVGRPIITTDAPGCKETVINNKNGFLVPIKNVSSLVEKMKYIIKNPQIIGEMGLESHRIAVEKYDVNKVNKSIIDFIHKDIL